MKIANKLAMTIAGLFLVVASFMKVHQMLTEPIISNSFWESWHFFLIANPLEFGLGVWLLSGIFRKAGWLMGTLSFGFFIGVTLFKAVTGQESCGCFGIVHVNPWITLFAIDVPIFLLLVIFSPRGEKLLPPPWPHGFHCLAITIPACLIMGAMVPTMYFNKVPHVRVDLKTNIVDPPQSLKDLLNQKKDDPNEVVQVPDIDVNEVKSEVKIDNNEPNEVIPEITTDNNEIISKTPTEVNEADLPNWQKMLLDVDIIEQLLTDVKIVMFYHYNCEDCQVSVPLYNEYSTLYAADDSIQFAFISGPPHAPEGEELVPQDTTAIVGKLGDSENWVFESPLTFLLIDGTAVKGWQVEYPDMDQLIEVMVTAQ